LQHYGRILLLGCNLIIFILFYLSYKGYSKLHSRKDVGKSVQHALTGWMTQHLANQKFQTTKGKICSKCEVIISAMTEIDAVAWVA